MEYRDCEGAIGADGCGAGVVSVSAGRMRSGRHA